MSVASTKAFSNMVAALALFALQAARVRHMSIHEGQNFARELSAVPDKVSTFLELTKDGSSPISEALDKVTRWVCDSNCTIFLGRGVSSHVASEGALKLMEVAYIPCIAYHVVLLVSTLSMILAEVTMLRQSTDSSCSKVPPFSTSLGPDYSAA